VRLLAPAVCLVAVLASAAPAGAEVRTETFRHGPIEVGGYEVKQENTDFSVPEPNVDGFITHMEVDVVDASGAPVPISRLMLHHIVFLNSGRAFGEKKDGTCDTFLGLDSKTEFPAIAERFYAAGEERAELDLPPGYGYRINAGDRWLMTWMLMNHRKQTDRAFIQYKVTYDTSPDLQPVTPYWLDVRNCRSDPVFDAPGGGRAGSRYETSDDWTVPESGRIVAAGGHVHGGSYALRTTMPDCDDRTLWDVEPAWGLRSHPFYNVKPVLHEPGPIATSWTQSSSGFRVSAGERLRLTASYDNARPHTRAMGIQLLYLAPDAGVTERCAPPPADAREFQTTEPHRTSPPRIRVPLIGLDARGRAVEIKRPPGRVRRVRSGSTIPVRDFAFRVPNAVVRRGATVRWRFDDPELHNVTLADGPRGFSSEHLSEGRTFAKRLTVPGRYKLFCGLHPVSMTQTVRVRR
jgi:plastocyanin